MGSPRHLPSIAQLVLATVAAAGGLFVGVRLLRPAIWMSPFNPRDRPPRTDGVRTEMDRIRARFAGRRTRLAAETQLPAEAIRLLQPLIAQMAEHAQCSPRQLSSTTRAILDYEAPADGRRPRGRRADELEVAAVVHAVLDELDTLPARPHSSHTTIR